MANFKKRTAMFETLKNCINKQDKESFLRSLGYKSVAKGERTLEAFLSTKTLYEWIQRGHFDFRYSAEEFVLALAKECKFDEEQIVQEIEKAKKRQIQIAKLPIPYIFVDTNFKRTTQPVFVLAFCEGLRRIKLDKETLYNNSKEQRLSKVSKIIKKHYEKSGGELKIWGKIHSYNFHDIDGLVYVFDTDGKLIQKDAHVDESRATLSV